eukprot:13018240-Alexandrium_andersonii.AAC.1
MTDAPSRTVNNITEVPALPVRTGELAQGMGGTDTVVHDAPPFTSLTPQLPISTSTKLRKDAMVVCGNWQTCDMLGMKALSAPGGLRVRAGPVKVNI